MVWNLWPCVLVVRNFRADTFSETGLFGCSAMVFLVGLWGARNVLGGSFQSFCGSHRHPVLCCRLLDGSGSSKREIHSSAFHANGDLESRMETEVKDDEWELSCNGIISKC